MIAVLHEVMRLALLAFLLLLATTACDPEKEAVPDPAQPPKPRLADVGHGESDR
jgi:hypothetical protein